MYTLTFPFDMSSLSFFSDYQLKQATEEIYTRWDDATMQTRFTPSKGDLDWAVRRVEQMFAALPQNKLKKSVANNIFGYLARCERKICI